MRTRESVLFIIISNLSLMSGCSGEDSNPPGEPVVIGGLFSHASTTSSARIAGVQMAVRDINESGVFAREFKAVIAEFGDDSDRKKMSRDLYDTSKAVAMVSEWSSTALNVLDVTNDPTNHYTDFVDCSASSTNTKINDPTISDSTAASGFKFASDKNDTLYRGVSNDKKQARVVWTLISDKSKAGIFYVDDAYGQSFNTELETKIKGENKSFVFQDKFPANNFSVNADVKAKIDSIISKSLADELTTLVLIALPNHGGPIMKELTEAVKPYKGTIVVTDGSIDASFFGPLTDKFTVWIETAGNRIVGTAPENYSGDISSAWVERLKKAIPGMDLSDSFVPSAADCTYAFAIALMYADEEASRYTAKSVKNSLSKLKESAYKDLPASSIEQVDANPAGLKAANQAVKAKKIVRLNGASGVFVFDADGDRINQPYRTIIPKKQGNYTWERSSIYSGDTGECIKDCK